MATPQRTNTKFPGNSPLGKRRAETDLESPRLSASNIPKVPRFLGTRQRVSPPAQLPIKPNHRSQQFSPTSRFDKQKPAPLSRSFVNHCNPWQGHEYLAILKGSHRNGVIIAHKQEISHPMVAVTQCDHSANVKNLISCSSQNLVHLYEVYNHDDKLYFMYECMDISLCDIQATPYGDFAPYQIAAICQEVISITLLGINLRQSRY